MDLFSSKLKTICVLAVVLVLLVSGVQIYHSVHHNSTAVCEHASAEPNPAYPGAAAADPISDAVCGSKSDG